MFFLFKVIKISKFFLKFLDFRLSVKENCFSSLKGLIFGYFSVRGTDEFSQNRWKRATFFSTLSDFFQKFYLIKVPIPSLSKNLLAHFGVLGITRPFPESKNSTFISKNEVFDVRTNVKRFSRHGYLFRYFCAVNSIKRFHNTVPRHIKYFSFF